MYRDTLDFKLLAPEFADVMHDKAALLKTIKAMGEATRLRAERQFDVINAISSQETIDEDDTTRFHMALNRVDTSEIENEQLIAHYHVLEDSGAFSTQDTKEIKDAVHTEWRQTRALIDTFGRDVLAPMPEHVKSQLYAHDPILEQNYGGRMTPREPVAEVEPEKDAGRVQKAKQFIKSRLERKPDPLVYEGSRFKHSESFNPEAVYTAYDKARKSGEPTPELKEQLAEAFTYRMLKDIAERRKADPEHYGIAHYYSANFGIPGKLVDALLSGEQAMTSCQSGIYAEHQPTFDWQTMAQLAVNASYAFSDQHGKMAEDALKNGKVYASIEGSKNAAFTAYPQLRLTEWTGSNSYIWMQADKDERKHHDIDALNSLAHELGHYTHKETLLRQGDAGETSADNAAYNETISHINEYLLFGDAIKNAATPEAKMAIGGYLMQREALVMDKMLANLRTMNELEPQLEGRTKPFTFDEIDSLFSKHASKLLTAEGVHWDNQNIVIFSHGSNYVLGYCAAITAARAFNQAHQAADESGKQQLAQQYEAALTDTQMSRWDELTAQLGIDVTAPDFLASVAHAQRDYMQKLAQETGLELPEDKLEIIGGKHTTRLRANASSSADRASSPAR